MSDRIVLQNLVSKLKSGNKLVQKVVLDIMSDAFGGGAATGRWNWKQATDLIEGAMSSIVLEGQHQTLTDFTHLQSLAPHHQVRSEEQMELQQFSTTLPLAWIVKELAAIQSTDTVLEPSAGTGILAASSIYKLQNNPQLLILNEISKSRNLLLYEIFAVAPIYSIDAEYLNDILPQTLSPDIVVMNPPFSSSISRSKRDPDVCLKHVRSALSRLKPQGRLVAIVAHWLSPEKYPQYFANLPAQLQSSFFVEGRHYRYHGTTMDVRVLVFDKVPQSHRTSSIDRTKLSIEQLAELLLENTPSRLKLTTN